MRRLLLLLLCLVSIPWNVSLFFASPWGAERLAGLAERVFARAFRGRLLLGGLRLEGPATLVAEPALLLDPRGAPAASLRALRLRLSPLGLLSGEARIEELRLEGPRVRIAADDPLGGLGAVFLPEQPPSPGPPGAGEPPRAPLPLSLEALRLREGAFLLSSREGERQVWVEAIEIFAAGAWEGLDARLSLYLDAAARRPVEAPLHLRLRTELRGWALSLLDLRITLGETEIRASGVGDIDELWGEVALSGAVSPREARQLEIPLARRLPLSGEFFLSRESRGDLLLRPPGGGEVHLELESEGFLRFEGGFTLRQTDPSAFLEGAPRARLNGRGRFDARLGDPPEARFSLRLDPGTPIGPGHVRGRLHGQGVELEEFALELPGADARAEGRLGAGGLRLRLRLDLRDLARLARSLGASLGAALPPLEGQGRVELEVEGALADPAFDLRGRFPRLRVGELRLRALGLAAAGRLQPLRGELEAEAAALLVRGVDLERLRLSASRDREGLLRFGLRADEEGARDAVIAEGRGALRGERIRASGEAAVSGIGSLALELDLPARRPRPRDRLHVDLRIDPLDLGRLGAWLDRPLPPGIVRSRLRLRGSAERPEAEWTTLATGLRPLVDRGPRLDAQLVASLHPGEASLSALAWDRAGVRILELSARAPLEPLRLLRRPEAALRALLDEPRVAASLRLQGIDLAAWSPLSAPGLRGSLMAQVDLRGPPRSPLGEARLELAAGPLGPLRKVDLALAARSTPEEVRLDLLGRLLDQAPLRLLASAGVSAAELLDPGPDTPVSLFWELPSFDLATLPMQEALAGRLSSRGHLRGPLAALRGRAVVDARELAYGRTPLGSAGARLDLGPAPDLHLFAIDPQAGTLAAHMKMEGEGALIPWDPRALAERRWALRLDAEAFSLAPISLLPDLAAAEGKLHASLAAEGRIDEIFPTGSIEIREGVIQPVGGLRYDRVGLRAALEPGRIDLAYLEAHGREGLAVLRGTLAGSPGDLRLDLRLRSRDFPVGGSQGVAAFVTTRGTIEGRLAEALRATIRLGDATVELPSLGGRQLHDLAPPDEVVLFEAREEEATRGGGLPLAVDLVVEEPIRVRAPDVSLDVDLELSIHREAGGPLLASGAARSQAGQLSLFGRAFTVEPSRVRWVESPLGNPSLDVTARFQTVAATAWVDVGGTVAAPAVNLRSDPPMSEGEIALLIAAGGARAGGGLTPVEGEPVDETEAGLGAAASLLGAVAADRFLQALGPGVPIDVLTVEAEAGRTLLQAGTRLGPRLYLGYARNLFPEPWENANEVRVSYQLSRTLAVESSYGDAGNGGVDLVWVEQFPTATQRERRRAAAAEAEEEVGRNGRGCVGERAVVACGP